MGCHSLVKKIVLGNSVLARKIFKGWWTNKLVPVTMDTKSLLRSTGVMRQFQHLQVPKPRCPTQKKVYQTSNIAPVAFRISLLQNHLVTVIGIDLTVEMEGCGGNTAVRPSSELIDKND